MEDAVAIALLTLLIFFSLLLGGLCSWHLHKKIRTERQHFDAYSSEAGAVSADPTRRNLSPGAALRTRQNSVRRRQRHRVWEMAPLDLTLRHKIIQAMAHIQTRGVPFTVEEETSQAAMWLPRGGGAWITGTYESVSSDMLSLSARIKTLWRAKRGDITEELTANLPFPDKPHPHALLREVADRLWEKVGHLHPTKSPLSLLAMLLFTQELPDTDRLLLFDAPVWAEGNAPNRELWDAYIADDFHRDGCIRSEMDSAMLSLLQSLHLDDSTAGNLASAKASKWVKLFCTLAALTTTHPFHRHYTTPGGSERAGQKSAPPPSNGAGAPPAAAPRPPVLFKAGVNIPRDVLAELTESVAAPQEGLKRGGSAATAVAGSGVSGNMSGSHHRPSSMRGAGGVTFDELPGGGEAASVQSGGGVAASPRCVGWAAPVTCSFRADAVRPKESKAGAQSSTATTLVMQRKLAFQKTSSRGTSALLRFHGVDTFLDFAVYATQRGSKGKREADGEGNRLAYTSFPPPEQGRQHDTSPLPSSEEQFVRRGSGAIFSEAAGGVVRVPNGGTSKGTRGGAGALEGGDGTVHSVSQYPDEHAAVIPPFSMFTVKSVLSDPILGTVIDLEFQGVARAPEDCAFSRDVLNEIWQADSRLHRVTVLLDTLVTANETPHTLYVDGAGHPADGVYSLSDRKVRGFPLWVSHQTYYSIFTSASSHRWCIGRDAESGAGRVMSETHNGTMPHLVEGWMVSSATKANRGWLREPSIRVSAKAERPRLKQFNWSYGQRMTHFRPMHVHNGNPWGEGDDLSDAVSIGSHGSSDGGRPSSGGGIFSRGAPLLCEDKRSASESQSPGRGGGGGGGRGGYAPPVLEPQLVAGRAAAQHFLPLLQGLWWTKSGVSAHVSSLTVTFTASTVPKPVVAPLKLSPEGSVLLAGVAMLSCNGEEARWADGDTWARVPTAEAVAAAEAVAQAAAAPQRGTPLQPQQVNTIGAAGGSIVSPPRPKHVSGLMGGA